MRVFFCNIIGIKVVVCDVCLCMFQNTVWDLVAWATISGMNGKSLQYSDMSLSSSILHGEYLFFFKTQGGYRMCE